MLTLYWRVDTIEMRWNLDSCVARTTATSISLLRRCNVGMCLSVEYKVPDAWYVTVLQTPTRVAYDTILLQTHQSIPTDVSCVRETYRLICIYTNV